MWRKWVSMSVWCVSVEVLHICECIFNKMNNNVLMCQSMMCPVESRACFITWNYIQCFHLFNFSFPTCFFFWFLTGVPVFSPFPVSCMTSGVWITGRMTSGGGGDSSETLLAPPTWTSHANRWRTTVSNSANSQSKMLLDSVSLAHYP